MYCRRNGTLICCKSTLFTCKFRRQEVKFNVHHDLPFPRRFDYSFMCKTAGSYRGPHIVSKGIRNNKCCSQMMIVICLLLVCVLKEMESKCLFESRGDSCCSESCTALIKLSTIPEYEIIINRCSLPLDLSTNQIEQLWICKKHSDDLTKYWRPRITCQYPLHSGPKSKLSTRNGITDEVSRQIDTIYGKRVPVGSRK